MNLLLFLSTPNFKFRSGSFSLFFRRPHGLIVISSPWLLLLSQIFFWNRGNAIFWMPFSRSISWSGLHKLSRLWLLVSGLMFNVKSISRESDCNASSNDVSLFGRLILFLNFVGCKIALKLVLLVQVWCPRLDDLSSLERFGHVHLKSIQGDSPIIIDFPKCIIDDLPCACSHADFNQDRLFFLVFFKH